MIRFIKIFHAYIISINQQSIKLNLKFSENFSDRSHKLKSNMVFHNYIWNSITDSVCSIQILDFCKNPSIQLTPMNWIRIIRLRLLPAMFRGIFRKHIFFFFHESEHSIVPLKGKLGHGPENIVSVANVMQSSVTLVQIIVKLCVIRVFCNIINAFLVIAYTKNAGILSQFVSAGNKTFLNSFKIGIASSIQMHEVSFEIITFLNTSQILKSWMNRMIFENQLRKVIQIDIYQCESGIFH